MDNRELFQKYLDNELPEMEKSFVEDLIKTNPEAKDLFNSLKRKQELLLNNLDFLNPKEINVPAEFHQPRQINKIYWRIAASVIILLGITAILWFSKSNREIRIEENTIAEEVIEEIHSTELDYYISPNRCWRKRELVWTFLETK